jgi:hypothetical protein
LLLLESISLNRLKRGYYGVSPTVGATHAEACIVCFDTQKFKSGVELIVEDVSSQTFQIIWDDIIDEQLKRTWNDLTIATEWAACGIAFLIVEQVMGLEVVRQARKGGGFDYWLGEVDSTKLLVQEKARLEVSGILKAENPSQIRVRLRQKIKQIKAVEDELPKYAIVVEFSTPTILIGKA